MYRLILKLLRRRRLQRDLEAELAFHREMAAVNTIQFRWATRPLFESRHSISGASISSRIFGGISSTASAVSGAVLRWLSALWYPLVWELE